MSENLLYADEVEMNGNRGLIRTSYSALNKHRMCPQAWKYARIDRLRNIETIPAVERDFGSWWHALRAAEALERGRAAGSLKFVPRRLSTHDEGPEFDGETVTVEEVLAAAREWWAAASLDVQAEWNSRLGEGLPDRLEHLLASWRAQWGEQIAREHPLAVEMWWQRYLPRLPEDETSPDVIIGGFIDEVYLDTKRRLIVVRDHKTHKALATRKAHEDMMDSQLQLYAWGAAKQVRAWGLGGISATSFDRVRSKAPTTPVLTKGGSLSKSVTDFDLATYLSWVGEGIAWGEEGEYVKTGARKGAPKFGVYTAEEKVIESLSDPASRSAWFQRTLVPMNQHLIRTHLRSAVDSALDSWRSRIRAESTGEAQRNLARHCSYCEFASLCRAQMIGGPRGDYDLSEHGLRVLERRSKRGAGERDREKVGAA